jgi:hypothetical protein
MTKQKSPIYNHTPIRKLEFFNNHPTLKNSNKTKQYSKKQKHSTCCSYKSSQNPLPLSCPLFENKPKQKILKKPVPKLKEASL